MTLNNSEELVQAQYEIEKRYSNNQLIPRLKRELKQEPEILNIINTNNLPLEFCITALVHLSLMRRANVQTMVGLMRNFYEDIQDVAAILMKMIEVDLMDFDSVFITKYLISQETQIEIDRYQFPLPMVIQPLKLRTNKDTGYLTSKSSVILNNNHTEEDVCLDHLNRLNKIPLSIDIDTATFIKNKWRNLDHKKSDETFEEYQNRKKQFKKYNDITLFIMEFLKQFSDTIYLTHSYDKRGRTYTRGYHINDQGNGWNKAVINFSKGEYIND